MGFGELGQGAARWYIVQVAAGRERSMARRLTGLLGSALREPVFQPTCMTEIKVRGAWELHERALLEGYLIAVTDQPDLLEKVARESVSFCRVLGTDDGPVALSCKEAELFGGLGEPGHRCLPLSRGFRANDGSICVTEGPLVGRESLIQRVDRRRALAFISVNLGDCTVQSCAGLALMPSEREGAAGRVAPQAASTGARGRVASTPVAV